MNYSIKVLGGNSAHVAEWVRSNADAIGAAYLKVLKAEGLKDEATVSTQAEVANQARQAECFARSVRLMAYEGIRLNLLSDALENTLGKSGLKEFVRLPYWS